MRVLLSNNPGALSQAMADYKKVAVVEAEYGEVEVTGSTDQLTLNHHIRPNKKCPCLYNNEDISHEDIEVIGISHFDLDTLGGVLALMGLKPGGTLFWEAAAYIDTNGPHRFRGFEGYSTGLHLMLAAFWNWSRDHQLFADRDGAVTDVTDFFLDAGTELEAILSCERLSEGKSFLKKEEDLKRSSFVRIRHRLDPADVVVLREADTFVNHLYYDSNGRAADIVVGYNNKTKTVTLSCSDRQINCKEIVQDLWGELAGGHAGIAGSPRGQEMTFLDAEELFERV